MVIKLTFDTNCILRDEQDKRDYYEQIKLLEELSKKGIAEINKTDVQDTEIGQFPPRLEKSKEFKEKAGIIIFGHSRFDHCVFASESEGQEFDKLRENQKTTKKENDIKDTMILHTHKKYDMDFLITNNTKDFVFDKDKTNIVNPVKIPIEKLKGISSEEELKQLLLQVKE
jgi:hypothetical protein